MIEVAEAVEASLDRERCDAAWTGSTDVQRQAITLAYYGGRSYGRSPRTVTVTLGTIKTRSATG